MITKTQTINLAGMGPEELCRTLASLGMKPFRGKQVFQWIHKRGEFRFENMTDLSLEDRERMLGRAHVEIPSLSKKRTASDGTEKFLFALEDGHSVEGVLIPEEKRLTLCISTQVGCAMGCTFCLTGKGGLIRNLKAAEIAGQVLRVREGLPRERPLTHLVLMGMGEPLANYENTLQAVRILLDPLGANFSKRRITLSTSGLVPGIRRLAGEHIGIHLAVSLNAADNSTRSRIMPINRKHPIEELLKAVREYPLSKRSRITFEYVLILGVNDSLKDAERLALLLRDIPCKINLIPLNPVPGSPFRPPPHSGAEAFQRILLEAHYTAPIRESRGREISAACGQLREKESGWQ